jgi:hypothetical protein
MRRSLSCWRAVGRSSWWTAGRDRLRGQQTVAALTNVIQKGIEGQVRGLEPWGNWRPNRSWRLDAGLLWLSERFVLKPGVNELARALTALTFQSR